MRNQKSLILISLCAVLFAVIFFYQDSFVHRKSTYRFGSKKSGVVFHDRLRSSNSYFIVNRDVLKPTCQVMGTSGKVIYNFPQAYCYFFKDGAAVFIEESGEIKYYNPDGKPAWTQSVHGKYDLTVSPDEKEIFVFSYPPGQEVHYLLILGYSREGKEIFRWDGSGLKDEKVRLPASLQILPTNSLVHQHNVFRPGNILLNSFVDNKMYIIDRETKQISWAFALKNHLMVPEAPNLPPDQPLHWRGAHKVHLLPTGEFLYMDYIFRPTPRYAHLQFPAVERLDILSGETLWSYYNEPIEKGFTSDEGSVEILENGNYLITLPLEGSAFELTPEGRVVWEWFNTEKVAYDLSAPIHRVSPVSKDRIHRFIRNWERVH